MSEKPRAGVTKCPTCGRAAAPGAKECPACGLVFAKWQERQNKAKLEQIQRAEREEKEKKAALRALELPEDPRAAPVDLRTGRMIAAAFVALWILAMAAYYHSRLPAMRAAAELNAPPGR